MVWSVTSRTPSADDAQPARHRADSVRLKRAVLIGGGHSHVQVLRAHQMRPLPLRLTVVVDSPIAVYSGMVPGVVAGQYATEEVEIDVRPLARRAGAAVVVARATGVDPERRQIHLRGRPPLAYDVASINVGSQVAGLDQPGVRPHALPTRPIARLVRELQGRLTALSSSDGPARVVVVGAGAGGVELAFCLRERLRAEGRRPQVTVVTAAERPLQRRPAGVSARVVRAMEARDIVLRCGLRVSEVAADAVRLESGETLPSDLTVWVVGAAALPWLSETGLPTDGRGFVWIDDQLRVEGVSDLFAVGDCAVMRSWPEIPKAGVYAVRQGPILVDNLRRWAEQRTLTSYRPQTDFFTLLNLGDGTAIGAKWGVHAEGRWLFAHKDRIDRAFMGKFQVLDPDGAEAPAYGRGMPPMPEMVMVCGGCAAKVGQGPLERALGRLDPAPADPSVIMGLVEPDDAVAFTHDGRTWVSNVDAFTAFTDDPWLVGRVAALNAMSDLWAKGATPRYALAIVAIPETLDPEETLFQVLSGARVALDAAGVTLMGGHTTIGSPLSVGFSVTGPAEQPLWPIRDLRDRDALVLTRPLGTGVLLHADGAGRARGPWVDEALDRMLHGNGHAAAVCRRHPVSAVTDVTGFGLAIHLGEMLRASGLAADLWLDRIPLLPGVDALLGRGERSTFHHQNRDVLKALAVDADARSPSLEVLFDPQTGGPLLVGIAPESMESLMVDLRAAGDPAVCIGTATALRDDLALMRVLGTSQR